MSGDILADKTDQKITFYPQCKKPVEAKNFLGNVAVVAFLDSVLPTITYKCRYHGLLVQLSVKKYEKLIDSKKPQMLKQNFQPNRD